MKKHNIALFGFGTVGGGVGDMIVHNCSYVEIKHIAVKSIEETDMLSLPASLFTENHDDIWNDESVDTVVELIGGTGLAHDIIEKALSSGKNVVTANKAVIAKYGNELVDIAKSNNVELLYEAAVGGGIPIIETLKQHCRVGKIVKIEGIINGTCNYILSEMEKGREYQEVLKEAQEKGYAEADPTADVGGFDMADKIGILSGLAFEKPFLKREEIDISGIEHVTLTELQELQKEGKTLRLVASCTENGAKVGTEIVDENGKMGSVKGAENIVIVHHEYLGEISLTGQGAGRYPTAVSVVADILKCAS